MPREAEPSLNEKSFILQALSEGIRLDSRRLDDLRELNVNFGHDFGTADIQLGLTRIIAKVSAEVTQPFPDRKFDGIFTINLELSPIASPAFEIGRQAELESLLSRFLEKAIRRSNALDTESLCIIAGRKCWNIRVDIHVLDHDGGLIDGSCIAAVAALRHFRRPDVNVDGEDIKVYSTSERVPVPLALLHHPYCITLSFFREGDIVIVDASFIEQQVSLGEMVITANRQGEICQMAKLGGVPTDAVTLLQCIDLATKKVEFIANKVSQALELDDKGRKAAGFLTELTAENER